MRILWLKTELLHPVDKGGKIRTYHMLKEMKRDHHITYLTLDGGTANEDARSRAEEYCHELVCVPHRTRTKFSAGFYFDLAQNLTSKLPYVIKKYESQQMRREVVERAQKGTFDVIVCDFLTPSVNVPIGIPCATVLFQHNVEAMIWKRHYEIQQNTLKKVYLRDQWRKMKSFERATCRRYDCVVAVSLEDRETMQREYGVRAVEDVPTGVDTEFFRPRRRGVREPHHLVFTGSMDWLPNEDAIRYFTEQIMPLIKQSVSDVRLTVVGRNPSESLLELSKRDSAVTVTGRVEDVRPYMERAAAFIVPIRIGGGTRLKIYEAMAMEQAIVSTTVGAEGLPVKDGKDVLLADTPQDFAGAVVRVLTDTNFANELGLCAASTVREKYGWDKVTGKFVEICQRAIHLCDAGRKIADTEENIHQLA